MFTQKSFKVDAPFKLESLYLGQGSSGPSPLFFQLDRNSRGRKRRGEGGRHNLLGINRTMKSLCGGPAYSSSLCVCACVCAFRTYTFCVAFQEKKTAVRLRRAAVAEIFLQVCAMSVEVFQELTHCVWLQVWAQRRSVGSAESVSCNLAKTTSARLKLRSNINILGEKGQH